MWKIRYSDEFPEINRDGVWFVENDSGEQFAAFSEADAKWLCGILNDE